MRINAYNIEEPLMRTREFIKLLRKNGWTLKRHGANHDIYAKGDLREPVPRHFVIDDDLARAIIKRRNLK